MLQILQRITTGRGEMEDLVKLEEIANQIASTSLCGLGQGAPMPVLSTLKYFREEYEEHVMGKHCRAGTCKGLGSYIIEMEECILCGQCKEVCAYDAVKETRDTYFIDQDYCTKCRACYNVCPTKAVKYMRPEPAAEGVGR